MVFLYRGNTLAQSREAFPTHTIDSLLRSDRREFRFLFRVSQAEFERLVLRFRNYKMFLT
jgi:hypothetical protein